ncbi:hypothetical protein [Pseudomonas sp. NFACC04-2]|uniref:hypothetical protein n=1 Tax=Pseudomonas sp. NFACC04-2 TaxID=1566242 RepID=UPI001114D673|nr:hypothetical protein [Pseudomonas sp. NFACC04-2]
MNDIVELAKTPAFWFSSVMIAFLMSLFSSYARDWIDGGRARLFSKWKAKKAQNDKVLQEKLEIFKADATLISLYQSDIVFQKVRNVLYHIVVYIACCFSLHNAANYNFEAALIFGAIALFIFSIPVQLTNFKINKMSKFLNALTSESESHFEH